MMMVKLPRMSTDEITQLLKRGFLCRVAFHGETHPYIAPFQYAYVDGNLYVHFTNYGKKQLLIKNDSRVSVEVEMYQPDFSEYQFVVLQGSLEVVTSATERTRVLKKMAADGRTRVSPQFLYAHGIDKEQGWSALESHASPTLMKLVDVVEQTGLKSPSAKRIMTGD